MTRTKKGKAAPKKLTSAVLLKRNLALKNKIAKLQTEIETLKATSQRKTRLQESRPPKTARQIRLARAELKGAETGFVLKSYETLKKEQRDSEEIHGAFNKQIEAIKKYQEEITLLNAEIEMLRSSNERV
jgi:hypothetical protein